MSESNYNGVEQPKMEELDLPFGGNNPFTWGDISHVR